MGLTEGGRIMAFGKCSVDGCEYSGHLRAGMCGKHRARYNRYGTTDLPEKYKKKCSVDLCENIERGKTGLCEEHYRINLRYGSPEFKRNKRAKNGEPEKFIEIAKKYTGDDCLIWPYGKDKDGYGWCGGEAVHRIVCPGEPKGERDQAAHYCGNPSCVNPNHLRWATKSENMQDKHLHGTMPVGDKHWKRRNS